MKRFMLALALIAVAGATYVATAPGSQQAGPTAKQFKALQKQVIKLKKDEAQVRQLAIGEAVIITDCMSVAKPIAQFGDPNMMTGYSYNDGMITGPKPALNYAGPTDQNVTWFPGGGSACGTDLNAAVRKVARLAGIRH